MAELSLAGFDVLWDDLRLGATPFPLEVPSHGDTLEERARIKTAVYGALERGGLVRGGRPVPDLEDALRLLAAPDVSVSLVVMLAEDGDRPARALAAARGKQAVLVAQRDQGIQLTEVRDTAVISAVVDLLPANRPGPGRSVTLLAPAQGNAEPGNLMRPAMDRAQGAELRQLTAIMERPIRRAGLLGLTLRDGRGKPQRLPGLTWLDNDQGRYALSVRPSGDGANWTTLTPADNPRLAGRLAEILAAQRSS